MYDVNVKELLKCLERFQKDYPNSPYFMEMNTEKKRLEFYTHPGAPLPFVYLEFFSALHDGSHSVFYTVVDWKATSQAMK